MSLKYLPKIICSSCLALCLAACGGEELPFDSLSPYEDLPEKFGVDRHIYEFTIRSMYHPEYNADPPSHPFCQISAFQDILPNFEKSAKEMANHFNRENIGIDTVGHVVIINYLKIDDVDFLLSKSIKEGRITGVETKWLEQKYVNLFFSGLKNIEKNSYRVTDEEFDYEWKNIDSQYLAFKLNDNIDTKLFPAPKDYNSGNCNLDNYEKKEIEIDAYERNLSNLNMRKQAFELLKDENSIFRVSFSFENEDSPSGLIMIYNVKKELLIKIYM